MYIYIYIQGFVHRTLDEADDGPTTVTCGLVELPQGKHSQTLWGQSYTTKQLCTSTGFETINQGRGCLHLEL